MSEGLLTFRHSASFGSDMATPDQIDLAHASAFRLGPITVEPALRQVTATRSETLEPRVMQVLVVLAMANGGIVSRDDLVRQCWEGRIVGACRIETITKVGYRLVGPIALVVSTKPEPLMAGKIVRTPRPDDAFAQTGPPTVPAASMPKPEQPQPPSRRHWLTGGAALLAAALGLLFWLDRATPSHETVPLTVVAFATSGVTAATAETLQGAMISSITPERFRVVGGTLPQAGYYITGRLVGSPSEVAVYPELYVPGATSPIWTPQKKYPRGTSLTGIASDLTWAARCIVEGMNELPLQKPPAATAGWVSYCDENNHDNYDLDRQVAALRVATRAEPRFVAAQVTLASFLGERASQETGKVADDLRAEGQRAAAFAEKIDPDNAEIYTSRAALTVATDFIGRDALYALALSSRPTGWGSEFQNFGYFLDEVGRQRDALEARKRTLAINPGNPFDIRSSASLLSMMGRYQQARAIFASESGIRPDHSRIDALWLRAALTGHDWEKARQLLGTVPDERIRNAMGPLVAALAANDSAAARSAGAAFEPLAKDPATMSGATAFALALSGRDQAALAAVRRAFEKNGPSELTNLYWPAFSSARRTPEFEAFVREIRLLDYWQTSGHRPDFCLAEIAPPLCAKLMPKT